MRIDTTTKAAIPAVGYFAKSTEDLHGSIETQRQDFREMAEREGWLTSPEWEFADENESGWSGNRGDGREGRFKHVEIAGLVALTKARVGSIVREVNEQGGK